MDGINTNLSALGGAAPQSTEPNTPTPTPPLLRHEQLTVQHLLDANCSLLKSPMEMSEEEWKAVTKSTLGDVYGLCEVKGSIKDFINKHKKSGVWVILYWALQNMLKDKNFSDFKDKVKSLLETRCLGSLGLKDLFLSEGSTILAVVQTCGMPMEQVCTDYKCWICQVIRLKSDVAQRQIDLAAKQRDLT